MIVPDKHMTRKTANLSTWLVAVCYGCTGGTVVVDGVLAYAGHTHPDRLGDGWVRQATDLWAMLSRSWDSSEEKWLN